MSGAETNTSKLPWSLKIASAYLLFSGVVGVLWLLAGHGPHRAEFTSLAHEAGAYAREACFAAALLISSVGIVFRKPWARKLALVILVIQIPYSATAFAWGFASGRPSPLVLFWSLCGTAVWNAFWFYIVFRRYSADALPTNKAKPITPANGHPR